MLKRDTVPWINNEQWNALVEYVGDGELEWIAVHALATRMNVESAFVVKLLECLEATRDVALYLELYHGCEGTVGPVIVRPFAKQMPSLPLPCPHCDLEITKANVGYGVVGKVVKRPLELKG